MSVHKSLNLGSGLSAIRSVYTRRERLDVLLDSGDYTEGDNPLGIRKVRTQFKTVSKKQLKAADKAQREADAAVAAEEAAAQREADAEFV
ncbi:MAG: small basic protein [Planctomycetota bacterium]|jgi:small basic protein (TIGR04137 family)|nr:small basic protein [Planctomycetota bacterium]